MEASKADSVAVETGNDKGKSPMRRLLRDLARDFAIVCLGLCFLLRYVSHERANQIGAIQFLLVLIVIVLSIVARWWIGLLICALLVFAMVLFCPL